jgi:hypothetical protein
MELEPNARDRVEQLAPAPASTADEEAHRNHSRRRRSKSTRRLVQAEKTVRNLKITLIIVLLAGVTTVLLGKTAIDRAREHNALLNENIDALEEKLQKAEGNLKTALEQMNALVEKRLPGIKPLVFEQVIPLNDHYAKNIVLTMYRSGEETRYEYRLVLFNQEITPVLPRATVYLFDRTGIQTGMSEVIKDGTAPDGHARALAPGEIRSFNGSVKSVEGREPAYFLVDVK